MKYHAVLQGVPIAKTKGKPQERFAVSREFLRTWARDLLAGFVGDPNARVTIFEVTETPVEVIRPKADDTAGQIKEP